MCPFSFLNMDSVDTLRLRQNGHYFADDISKFIFFNKNVWITIKISLKCDPKGLNDKKKHCFK